jgi:hypothetical protein
MSKKWIIAIGSIIVTCVFVISMSRDKLFEGQEKLVESHVYTPQIMNKNHVEISVPQEMSIDEQFVDNYPIDPENLDVLFRRQELVIALDLSENSEITSRMLLDAMDNEEFKFNWSMILFCISYILNPEDAREAVLDYVKRKDNISGLSQNRIFSLYAKKAWSLRCLGIVGDDISDSLLKEATTFEGARKYIENWDFPQEHTELYSKEYYIAFLRGAAYEGIGFSNNKDNIEMLRRDHKVLLKESLLEENRKIGQDGAYVFSEEKSTMLSHMADGMMVLEFNQLLGRDEFLKRFMRLDEELDMAMSNAIGKYI